VQSEVSRAVSVVAQERFLLSSNSISNATWWVPLTFTTQEAPDFNMTQPQLWLENAQSTVVEGLPSNTSWVQFNVHETGIYLFLIDLVTPAHVHSLYGPKLEHDYECLIGNDVN
jgi:hypothetical protein